MMKIMFLLGTLLLLFVMAEDAPAIGGDETLICYFHGTVYDILQETDAQCGLPSQQLIDDTAPLTDHDHKRLDVHDPECFTWVRMAAQ